MLTIIHVYIIKNLGITITENPASRFVFIDRHIRNTVAPLPTSFGMWTLTCPSLRHLLSLEGTI